jgi:LPXTG-motif cell wall-anchored protein
MSRLLSAALASVCSRRDIYPGRRKVFNVRFKLLTLAVIASFLIAVVPAFAQDTTGYTSTTPTVTTPTTPTTPTPPKEKSAVEPAKSSGSDGTQPSGTLARTGSNTWLLLAIGGVLAVGSALLLARERRPHR